MTQKHQGERTDITSGKSCQKLQAAERLSAELGVSPRTIRNDAKFAAAVDTLAPFVPDIAQRTMAGDAPMLGADIGGRCCCHLAQTQQKARRCVRRASCKGNKLTNYL